MIGTIFELINQRGESIKINDRVTDPNNFIALQEYPTFELGIKNQETQREGQHGIWDFYSFYDKRLIVFSGLIIGSNEEQVTIIQDQLKQVVSLPAEPSEADSGIITVKYTDPRGRALQTTGKLFSAIRFNRPMKQNYLLNFQLTLKSPDPEIVSQSQTNSTGKRGYKMGSLRVPFKLPATMPVIKEQTLTVNNLGNAFAENIITINGALTNPRLDNLTTGKYIKFTRTLTAGQQIIINSAEGTIVDENGADISSSMDAGSQFIKLKGGANILYLSSDENGTLNPVATRTAPEEILNVKHNDTYY